MDTLLVYTQPRPFQIQHSDWLLHLRPLCNGPWLTDCGKFCFAKVSGEFFPRRTKKTTKYDLKSEDV
jgi:hypothetical protein